MPESDQATWGWNVGGFTTSYKASEPGCGASLARDRLAVCRQLRYLLQRIKNAAFQPAIIMQFQPATGRATWVGAESIATRQAVGRRRGG